MNDSIVKITLDLQQDSTPVTVAVKRGDTGRKVVILLSDGGFGYDIAEGCYAVLTATKPDGNVLYNHCTIDGNEIIYEVTEQTTAAVGRMTAEIKLYGKDDQLVTSATFRIIVSGTVYSDGRVESKDEVSALTHLISETIECRDAAKEAADAASQAVEDAAAVIADAGNATKDANTAAGNANSAAGAANQAAVSAGNAAAAATTAAGNANTAAGKANTAATNASTATDEVIAAKDSFLKTAGNALEEIRNVVNDGADAPPIVNSARGEVITLNDSADRLLRGLKVFGKTEQRTTTGKNLLDYEKLKNSYGSQLPATVNDNGYVTLTNDTGSQAYPQVVIRDFVGKLITNIEVISIESGVGIYVKNTDSDYNSPVTTTGNRTIATEVNGYFRFMIAMQAGTSVTFRATVSTDENAEWEPYTGGKPSPSPEYPQELESVGDSVNVTVCGKNLLKNTATTQTVNNVTLTVNADGSVLVNGTNNGSNGVILPLGSFSFVKGEKYVLSGLSGFSPQTMHIWTDSQRAFPVGSRLQCYNGEVMQTAAENETCIIRIQVEGGATVNNITVYPMLRLASITDATYEPYKDGGSVTVSTPNGLPGIPVTSGGNYTDSTGHQWLCDEVDFEKGVYVQRVGVLDYSNNSTPEVQWGGTKDTNKSRWVLAQDALLVPSSTQTAKALCTLVGAGSADQTYMCQEAISCGGKALILYVEAIATMSRQEATAWLRERNVKVMYILAEENHISLSAEQLAAFAALHTNYPNTTVFNDQNAGMEVKYVADTKLYIDQKFNELAAALVSKV